VDDGKGAWATASGVHVRWSWPQLLDRVVAIDEVDVGKLTLARKPVENPAPTGGQGSSPVSLRLAKLSARVQLLPAFSDRYGLYDVTAFGELRRVGGVAATVHIASRTHEGDRVDAVVDAGRNKSIYLELHGHEAGGGAIAGALGLAANQPFEIDASAHGTTSEGSFRAASRSGAIEPIVGTGAWSPKGGQGQGSIVLSSTKLLSGYQQMLGPVLNFQVSGAKAPDGFYALTAVTHSDNADMTGRGEADVGRGLTGPKGLAVTILVKSAKRIVGWPDMGGGRFDGALAIGRGGWKLDGNASIQGPNAFDYRLAQIRGSLRLIGANHMLALQTTADGDGGAGRGLLPALLGARPHGAAELDWVAGGRVLVKSLNVTGPGLKIDGVGERNFFGALTFKGQASFSNFALAHPGAQGLMTAAWTAEQSGASPWNVAVDAKAQGFASGIDALDRLLGAAPRFTGKGAFSARGLEIASANVAGQSGDLNAAGLLGGDGGLQVKTDWRVKGPFRAGPLDISGKAHGTGDLTGTLEDPRADIDAVIEALDLPELTLNDARIRLSFLKGPSDTNGLFALAATSPYGPASADAGFRLLPDGFELTGLDAQAGGAHLQGQVALKSGAPSSADLTFSVGPGAFLGRGVAAGRAQLVDAAGGARASIKLTAAGALTREGGLLFQTATFTADGPLANLPYKLNASGFAPRGSWKLAGGGAIDGDAGNYGATFDGAGRLRNADFKLLQPAVLKWNDKRQSLSALAEVGGGRAQLDIQQGEQTFAAKAELTGVALGLLEPDFTGQFDANVALQGAGGQLNGEMLAKLSNAGERGAKDQPGLSGVVDAHIASKAVTLDAQLGDNQGHLASKAHLVLPAETSAAPFRIAFVRTAAMQGEFSADGDIKPLWDLLLGGDRSLGAVAHAHATLTGTLADPLAQGEATIQNGEFSDSATGLKLRGVTLTAELDRDAVSVSQFSAQDAVGGQLNGSGRISLQRAGASSFKLDLKGFRLIDNDLATAAATGEATLSRGADGAIKISGALIIDRADVAANPPVPSGVTVMDVVEINRQPGSGGHLQTVNAHAPAVGLDVTLQAPRGVFIKGRGLNLELALDAHVVGDTANPVLKGTAKVVRGDFDLAGKRFEFDNRGVVSLAADPEQIRLDLTASREDPSLTAVIRIEGTAAKPKITLTSTPVLPQDEVLSQVLFGTSTSQLGAGDAAELASAVSTLAGGSGFDVLGNLKSFAHLDRLAMGSGQQGGFAVSGGKYVTDNVYMELTGGGREGPSGEVDWRVRKDLSLVSKIAGGGGDSQVEVRWHK
ncbi:MAG TPA: translocation/assembly module TamB domain-containing protein, partial [Caulobacteraceae bacterium]|nr:translocation/assembly module TamB domain-containing protein [Caulobacteraceae bacterium]